MPFFTYACLVCYFASLGFVGCEAWASAAAPDDDGGAAVANPRRFLPGGHQVSWVKNGDVLDIVREFQGHEAIVDDQGKLGLPNTGFEMAAYNSAANDYAKEVIANKTVPNEVMDVMRRVPKDDYRLMEHLKQNIVGQITKALKEGAIITRSIPPFLQDEFENPAERVLREYVDSGRYGRSILEHIKTRAPWVVKGSTVRDLMIRDMADEYDVFDQEQLDNYQEGQAIKRFVLIPINLIRNDGTQEVNKNIVGRMFEANPNATLVVDYGDAEVASGLSYNLQTRQKSLPDSIRHISFVGESITIIECRFLTGTRLISVDLNGLKSVTRIEYDFITNCSNLTTIDLNPFRDAIDVQGHLLDGCNNLIAVDFTLLKRLQNLGAAPAPLLELSTSSRPESA